MCEDCKKEYKARGDVRRHAQTIACKACGPTLTYKKGTEAVTGNEQALTLAIDHLKVGGILAEYWQSRISGVIISRPIRFVRKR